MSKIEKILNTTNIYSDAFILIIIFVLCIRLFIIHFSHHQLLSVSLLFIAGLLLRSKIKLHIASIILMLVVYNIGLIYHAHDFQNIKEIIDMILYPLPLQILTYFSSISIANILRKKITKHRIGDLQYNYTVIFFMSLLSIVPAFFAFNILDFQKSFFEIFLALFLLVVPGFILKKILRSPQKNMLMNTALLPITMAYSVSIIGWPESFLPIDHLMIFAKTLPITTFSCAIGYFIGDLIQKLRKS